MTSPKLVVLDVNLILSGFLQGKGAAVEVSRRWENGAFDVAISEHIIRQVIAVWERPYFRQRSDEIDRALATRLMQNQARSVIPDNSVAGICDDEEDDLVLGTAIAAGADYLVTGDQGLLSVRSYGGVAIVTAREFLTILDID